MTDIGLQPGQHSAYLSWADASGQQNRLTFDRVDEEQWDEDAEVTEHPVEVGANVADHVRVELVKCSLKVISTNEPIDSNNVDQATLAKLPLNIPASRAQDTSPGTIIVPQWNSQIDVRALAGTVGGLLVGQALGAAGSAVASIALSAAFQGFVTEAPVKTSAGLGPGQPATPQSANVQTWPAGTDYVEAMHALLIQLKNSAQIIDVFGSKRVCFSMVIESLSFSRTGETGTGEDITIGLKELRVVSTQTVAAPIPNLSGGGGKPPENKGQQNPSDAPPAVQASVALNVVNSFGGAQAAANALAAAFGH